MKVLLLKDVYNLGRAGDVKKVADGYGRNFLVPQGLAVLATPGAMKNAEHIRDVAAEERLRLNQELGSVSETLEGLQLVFPMKAGETGRLYGSVTTAMIAEAIQTASGAEIDRRQIDSQPIKVIGVHSARIRLTIDLVPEISVIVHREGESPESVLEEEIPEEIPTEAFADLQAELDAEEKALEEETAAAEAEVGESQAEESDTEPVTAEKAPEEEKDSAEAEVGEPQAAESTTEPVTAETDVEAVEEDQELPQMMEEASEGEPDTFPDEISPEA
jgi:large subunit ribosomal protein L9